MFQKVEKKHANPSIRWFLCAVLQKEKCLVYVVFVVKENDKSDTTGCKLNIFHLLSDIMAKLAKKVFSYRV